ncbi:MAG: two-component sensor histidine kinase, partial [Desulfovibrio sp.]|nr:two-component sensor histidine kinase [Desulfovibrio sp.]
PLRGEALPGQKEVPIMGALEVTQDITEDYERVLIFQAMIVVLCLLSSVILFGLLLVLIHRSEHVLQERMHKNYLLEKELHSNEKLASMGRVVASIAHEIRNPLGIIRSSSELLLKREIKDRGTARILGAIFDEAVRLSQTVNDFLDYARPRKPKQDLVDLATVLKQVFAFLEGEFKQHQIEVHRSGETEGLFIYGDKDLLYRAFYNILVNSEQAMGEKGSIEVHMEKQKTETGTIEIVVTVHDSGPGIEPGILEHIMDPFFTTKDGGTGLGLPIVRSIITSHEGEIGISNAENGGTLIRLSFPVPKDLLQAQ